MIYSALANNVIAVSEYDLCRISTLSMRNTGRYVKRCSWFLVSRNNERKEAKLTEISLYMENLLFSQSGI